MSQTKGRDFLCGLRVFRIHLVGVEGFGVEERMRDHVLFAHRILDMLLQQLQIEQIGDAKAATSILSSYAGPMPREVVPIFTRPGAFSAASSIIR